MKSFARFVFIIVLTGAYFWLAVLGWGGAGAFFAQPAMWALAAATLSLAVASCFAGGNVSPGVREDRGNRWVLWAFMVLGLLDGYLPALTDRLDIVTLGGEGVRWLGLALYCAGGALRLWPVFVLGDRFSGLVAIQPGHRLMTDGIYGVIRHPSYAGLLLNSLGWGLTFRSGVGVMLTALIAIPLLARIKAEERLLAETFGQEYEAYRGRTWRLVPGLF